MSASKGRKRCTVKNVLGAQCRKLADHFDVHSFPPKPKPALATEGEGNHD